MFENDFLASNHWDAATPTTHDGVDGPNLHFFDR